MAGIAFPSWAYNTAGQASQIVQTQAAFNALGGQGTWQLTPVLTAPPAPVPQDPGFPTTDTRLQQMLIEQRMTNLLLQMGFSIADDPITQLRPEILANDSGVTT